MRSRYHRVVALAGVALLSLAVAACNPSRSGGGATQGSNAAGEAVLTIKAAAPSLTIAVPLTMAAKDTDAAHGIDVDLQASGTSSTNVVDAVVAGQVPYGSAGSPTVLQAIREGGDLQIIAAVVDNMQVMVLRNDVMQRLGVSPTAPIADRVRALRGLTIATGAIGSAHYQMLRSYLKRFGLDPDKDVRLVGTHEPMAMVAGIDQGRYDAIAYASGIVEQSVTNGVGTVWISGPRADIPGSADMKTSVIFARKDTIEQNGANVDALRSALTDALSAVHDDHAATGRILHEKYFPKIDPAVWEVAWNASTAGYPSTLAFTREAYQYWIDNDPKGPESYQHVNYEEVTYAPAQAS